MNLDKLMAWVVAVVLLFAGIGNLDFLQRWIWKAQAKAVFESRSSTWGSPRFFPKEPALRCKSVNQTKCHLK